MSHPPESPPPNALPAAAATASLAQSFDLIALTDAVGRLHWTNPAFERATGLGAGADLLALAPPDGPDPASGSVLAQALRVRTVPDTELALRGAGGATLWVRARVTSVADDPCLLWTLQDVTAHHALAAREQHQSELLEMAQEFGRLGVWEREIPSGKGRWDRHVFAFWGLDPAAGTPDHASAAACIHPDDVKPAYTESTAQAGRYAHRFRIMRPDGGVRWIHSQWEVKTTPQGVPNRTVGIMVDDTEALALARSLDRASAQLRLAAEVADIVLWRHDLKTDRVHYNDHGFKVLGLPYHPDGVPLADARLHTHPDDVVKLQQSAERALTTSHPVDVQTRHRRSDGEWRHMLLRRVVERDAAGEPIAFVGVSLDITDQVEQSRRAEALARRLEAAAGAARIGIWSTTFGVPRTEWNAQMYELFDMVGAERPPTLGEWLEHRVHPDDAERVRSAIQNYLRGKQGAVEFELRIRRGDGEVRWIMLRADVDRHHADGLQVFGIAMDVTDRHEALAALHRASERAALIAAHAGIGTWETEGPDGAARWDEQMFHLRGLEPRATAPERAERLELVHPDDRHLVIDADDGGDLAATSQAAAYEFRVRWPDGRYRWLASRSAVMRDAHGTTLQRVGVNWDVTEAKSADLARQQALLAERESQAKSQFLSRMSHELRTPLNAVLGFTQLLQLQARRASATEAIEKLDHIRVAGEHLLTLINDTLDLSSLEAGTLKLNLQPVALGAAVAQVLPMVAELAAAHQVSVRTGALDGAARADPGRLRQVLLNLLTNAIRFNRPGGQVIVETGATASPDQVRLRVRDTGRGMRPEQLEHLFEPFNRLGVEAEGAAGPGIGLTMVKALVEGMGGAVAATSEPGEGTLFEVTLPIPDWAGTPAATSAAAAPLTPRERSGQILYIEDNSVNVLLVEELVKSLSGLQIISEATGALGVERARSLRPDVILIDMQLPDFDGFEVLRRLRAQPETAATPCIALSANAMPDDIDRAMARGFDDYWTKPIKFRPFLDALERLFPTTTS